MWSSLSRHDDVPYPHPLCSKAMQSKALSAAPGGDRAPGPIRCLLNAFWMRMKGLRGSLDEPPPAPRPLLPAPTQTSASAKQLFVGEGQESLSLLEPAELRWRGPQMDLVMAGQAG